MDYNVDTTTNGGAPNATGEEKGDIFPKTRADNPWVSHTRYIMHRYNELWLRTELGMTCTPCCRFHSQFREQVNNVRMEVSPLWRGQGNIRGFVLDEKHYRQGQVTAQASNEPAIFGVRITLV